MVCSGGRYSESEQGSATLTVEAARSAGLWVGDGCCVDTQSFAVAGLTNEAGGYRFLLLGTHYVGKSGEVPASYTTSDSGLAGRRATDPHAFRLLAIAPRASVRETIVATNRDGDAQIVRLSIPYDRSFERPARVGALEGHFTTHLGTGYTFTLSIESTGRLTGIDTNGCRLQGRASARHPSFNAFDVALDVSACGESDGRYAGDAALLFGGSDRATGLFLSASNPNSAIGWRLDR
jgi:hypothetical protein